MAGPFFGHAPEDLTGGVYGSLYEDAETAGRSESCVAGGTFQGWKFATAGPLGGGMTADVADATADHLTIPAEAGDYLISVSVTWSPVTDLSQTFHIAVYLDGVQQGETLKRAKLESLTNYETTFFTVVLSLAASDEISLLWTNDTTAESVNFTNISLTARKLL